MEKGNFEDYAAGRVLLHAPGQSHFPVRLSCELFSRCLEQFPEDQKLTLYDPCCGGGYTLTVLGFHFADRLCGIFGSDISMEAVRLARQNLSLLTESALQLRVTQLEELAAVYGKDSHRGACESAERLMKKVMRFTGKIPVSVFQANALAPGRMGEVPASMAMGSVDILFADVPYGNLASWAGKNDETQGENPLNTLLDAVGPFVSQKGLVLIASDKGQRVDHSGWKRVEKSNHGKRRIEVLMRR